MTGITLIWPWAWLLAPLWWFIRPRPAALPLALPLAVARRRLPPPGRGALIYLLLVGALSQPVVLGPPLAQPASGRDLLLLIDVSGSMGTPDLVSRGRYLPRLEAVNEALRPLLQSRDGDRLALYVFGDSTYPLAPLTRDRDSLLRLLGQIEVGTAGNQTALGDAIAVTSAILAAQEARQRVMVVVTDGRNTAGFYTLDQALAKARQAGVRIHVLGVGSSDARAPQQLDETALAAIADASGGLYRKAVSGADLADFAAALDRQEPLPYQAPQRPPLWRLGPLLAAAALVLWAWSAVGARSRAS